MAARKNTSPKPKASSTRNLRKPKTREPSANKRKTPARRRTATKSRKSAPALLETNRLLNAVLNTIPARVFWKDKDLVYAGCNQAFAEDAGFDSPDQIIGLTDDQMPWAELAERFRSDDRAAMAGQRPMLRYEEPHITAGEETVWVETTKVPLLSLEGEVIGVLGTYHDITERKQAADALKESEQRFKDFATTAADRFWELDRDFRFTYVSPPKKLLTVPSERLVGKVYWEALVGSDRRGEVGRLRRLMEAHKPASDFIFTRAHGAGSLSYARVSCIPVFDDDGEFVGYRGSTSDVTMEVEAQMEADSTRKRFFWAMESLNAGFTLWDADDHFVVCNNYFRQLRPDSERLLIPGTSFEEYIWAVAYGDEVESARGREAAWVAEQLDSRKWTSSEQEIKLAGERWLKVKQQRLADGSTIAFYFDVTELKKQQQEAEMANRAKSEFLSSMSHELRTPLNAVIGFGELLQGCPGEILSPRQEEYVSYVIKSGQHLHELIDQILELSKIEAGKVSVSVEDVDLSGAIRDCLAMVEERAREKSVTVIDQASSQNLPVLRTDPRRFRQVLLNLLSNAVKYNRSGGTVTLEAAVVQPDRLRVDVIDTGFGIGKDQQSQVFVPFNRLGREAGQIEGTGIGLSISKQIVEHLDGRIGFESEEGVGSSFWFELPLAIDRPTPAPPG